MRYFFTSDTHFGHKNIIEYCIRPFSDLEHMHEEIIKRWNSVVHKNDIVFHLGDFVFRGKINDFRDKLNGTIIWLKGNHDSSSQTAIREMFIKLGGKEWHLLHNPAESLCQNVLCGHVHHLWKVQKIKDRIIVNVGVDKWNYTPVSIEQILNVIEKTKKRSIK